MFIVGLRDKFGVSISLSVAFIWMLGLVVVIKSSTYISFIIIFNTLILTLIASISLFIKRRSLIFINKYARDIAFPSSAASAGLSLVIQCMGIVFIYIPSVIILLRKPDDLSYVGVSLGYIAGLLTVIGVMFRAIVKVVGEKNV